MKILKYRKCSGLHIVCKKCNKLIENSQDAYKGCKHPLERQKYKAIIKHNGSRKTRDLKALNYDDAIEELVKFKKELSDSIKFISNVPKKEFKHELLNDCILMFSDWLENIDVPFFEQKVRTKEYIRDTVGYVCKLKTYLENNGHKTDKMTIYQLDKTIVNKYFEELYQKSKSIATYNHNIRALKGFYKFLIVTKGYDLINPLQYAKLKNEAPNPINVIDNDFYKIINCVTEENAIQIYKNGVKKNRYRPYIKEAFELIAYTGMRITEAISIKYSDIILSKNGEIEYVIGVDYKYEKAHNHDKSKPKKVVPIPYSPELEDLLERLDYKNHLGEDRYLIGANENISRESMAKQLSHSFGFYRNKAGITSPIGLKHLRKSFLTKIETQTGLVESLGYQKTKSVIQNNYLVKPEIAKAVKGKGFRLFQPDAIK
jgi:site-specific recombinase XerD